MVPPIAGLGPANDAIGDRHGWMTPDRLTRVRGILLGLTLFVGLAVYVFHTLGASHRAQPELVQKLRGVGVLTWIYALVQMADMRFYNSRWARRRRASSTIPETLHGWLFGQMLAWYGIAYYGFTQDARPFAAGVVILALTFWIFPIRRS
jgi:hypothetical protein